ncbi:Pilin (type 1 fimbria component protein) [Enterobacter sp. kpr-6]|uniref:fimbrial protein n=1 Tax=Enterobacter sp. kpr-6 TaxID=1761782 RepID=UPI0008EF63A5|nr:fimbrial protein [Enterobacter sp. kpr-6]SFR01158.1 Pilin (type 1 fimbria component protein) [Enterobacter sp. kpr-6]
MLKRLLTTSTALSLLSFSATAANTGVIDISGVVADNTCIIAINGGTPTAGTNVARGSVMLPETYSADFEPGLKGKGSSVTFDIHFSGCNPAGMSVSTKFKPTILDLTFSDSTVLKNTLSGNGAAEHVGVMLYRGDTIATGQEVTFDNTAPKAANLADWAFLTNGAGSLTYTAAVVRTSATLAPTVGRYAASAEFELTYK